MESAVLHPTSAYVSKANKKIETSITKSTKVHHQEIYLGGPL